jgi:hypothetical protein
MRYSKKIIFLYTVIALLATCSIQSMLHLKKLHNITLRNFPIHSFCKPIFNRTFLNEFAKFEGYNYKNDHQKTNHNPKTNFKLLKLAPIGAFAFLNSSQKSDDEKPIQNVEFVYGNKTHFIIRAYDKDKNELGYIEYYINDDNVGMITLLRIHKDHRRKKIGSSLFNKAVLDIISRMQTNDKNIQKICIKWAAMPIDDIPLEQLIKFYQTLYTKVIVKKNRYFADMELSIDIDATQKITTCDIDPLLLLWNYS